MTNLYLTRSDLASIYCTRKRFGSLTWRLSSLSVTVPKRFGVSIIRTSLLLLMGLSWSTLTLAASPPAGDCKADFSFAFLNDTSLIFFNTSSPYIRHSWTMESTLLYNDDNGVLRYTPDMLPFEACLSIETADACLDTFCLMISRESTEAFCIQNECVWPGDTNGDWKANQFDLLNIGLGYGKTGPPREYFPIVDNPTAWAPNTSADWDDWTNSSINYKHLDCDGDGIVGDEDVQAIIDNYRPDFSLVTPSTPGAPPVLLQFTSDVVEWDNTSTDDIIFQAQVIVGNSATPVTNLHGIALDFSYPGGLVDLSSITATPSEDSPLGPSEDLLTVKYDLLNLNIPRYDLAISRKASAGANGFGAIFDLNFIVSGDIIGGLNEPVTAFEIALERVRMINAQGDSIAFSIGAPTTISIVNSKLANTNSPTEETTVRLFPNPANHSFELQAESQDINRLELFDSQGRRLQSRNIGARRASIDVHRLKMGLYWVRMQIGEEWVVRRLVVQ